MSSPRKGLGWEEQAGENRKVSGTSGLGKEKKQALEADSVSEVRGQTWHGSSRSSLGVGSVMERSPSGKMRN